MISGLGHSCEWTTWASTDVEAEKVVWRKWIKEVYWPNDRAVKYLGFPEWLLSRGATKFEHETVDDG